MGPHTHTHTLQGPFTQMLGVLNLDLGRVGGGEQKVGRGFRQAG